MKIAAYALMPLFLLVLLVSLACVFGYGLLLATGDIVALDKLISKSTQFFLILCIFPLKKHLKFSWTEFRFCASFDIFSTNPPRFSTRLADINAGDSDSLYVRCANN